MGELLVDAFVFQILPNDISDKLGSVITAQRHAFCWELQQHQRQHNQHVALFNTMPHHMDQHLAAVNIDNGQQERIFACSMYVDVFDVHRQVLQRPIRLKAPETDKVPLKRRRPDAGAIQQSVIFHQPVYFLVIDGPADVSEFSGHVPISVAAELLAERTLDVFNHITVFNELAPSVHTMGRWFDTFRHDGALIIKATGRQPRPFQ